MDFLSAPILRTMECGWAPGTLSVQLWGEVVQHLLYCCVDVAGGVWPRASHAILVRGPDPNRQGRHLWRPGHNEGGTTATPPRQSCQVSPLCLADTENANLRHRDNFNMFMLNSPRWGFCWLSCRALLLRLLLNYQRCVGLNLLLGHDENAPVIYVRSSLSSSRGAGWPNQEKWQNLTGLLLRGSFQWRLTLRLHPQWLR